MEVLAEQRERLRIDTPPHLTPMQRKILNGVRSGLLNKQIAYDLGIAEATVKAHMTLLMRKFNACNRTQMALAAQAFTQRSEADFGR
jgi:DNA-binding NarL/FixJ family response regulator